MRIISKVLAVLVMGALASLTASPLAANFVAQGTSNFVFLGVFAITAILILMAPTGRRGWGRGSLITGALFIAMPLFMTGLSAQVGADMMNEATASGDQAATAAGAAIGGGLMIGASLFIGLLVGAIFLILGLVLVLGGRREVIVVNQSTAP